MNIFSQAAAGLNLTPGQRAFLKLVKGFVASAVLAGGTAVVQLVATGGVSDVRQVAAVGGVAFGTSLCFAFEKYFTAQGDAPLGAVAAQVGQMIETKAGPSDIVQPFTAPATVAPTA